MTLFNKRKIIKRMLGILLIVLTLIIMKTLISKSLLHFEKYFNKFPYLNSWNKTRSLVLNQQTSIERTSIKFKYAHLFKQLELLNTSKLETCSISKRQVKNLQHLKTNLKVLVPDWQNNVYHQQTPKTPHVYIAAILRVRLYLEDKAKWTIAELKQWIHYQFWAGVGHIYICSHYKHESERLETQLMNYTEVGLITVIPWNNRTAIPGTKNYHNNIMNSQGACYNHVLTNHRNDAKWFYSFDIDEYPYIRYDFCERFLFRYLRKIDSDGKYTAIYADTFLLKGQGDRERDMVIDRINRNIPKLEIRLVKPIYKSLNISTVNIHSVTVNSGSILRHDRHNLIMLHYLGARQQNWGPDTKQMVDSTVEFNDVRDTLAIAVRSSLLAFGEYHAFSNTTGP